MGSVYQRFLHLLSKWPVNSLAERMDYGTFLRSLLKNRLPSENIFPGTPAENAEKLDSLTRLLHNKYNDKYPHVKKVGASGMDVKTLKHIIHSNITDLNNAEVKKEGFFSKLFRKFKLSDKNKTAGARLE